MASGGLLGAMAKAVEIATRCDSQRGQFVRKPHRVDAIMFDGRNGEEVERWARDLALPNPPRAAILSEYAASDGEWIKTPVVLRDEVGLAYALVGDWLVWDGHKLQIVKPREFAREYEDAPGAA